MDISNDGVTPNKNAKTKACFDIETKPHREKKSSGSSSLPYSSQWDYWEYDKTHNIMTAETDASNFIEYHYTADFSKILGSTELDSDALGVSSPKAMGPVRMMAQPDLTKVFFWVQRDSTYLYVSQKVGSGDGGDQPTWSKAKYLYDSSLNKIKVSSGAYDIKTVTNTQATPVEGENFIKYLSARVSSNLVNFDVFEYNNWNTQHHDFFSVDDFNKILKKCDYDGTLDNFGKNLSLAIYCTGRNIASDPGAKGTTQEDDEAEAEATMVALVQMDTFSDGSFVKQSVVFHLIMDPRTLLPTISEDNFVEVLDNGAISTFTDRDSAGRIHMIYKSASDGSPHSIRFDTSKYPALSIDDSLTKLASSRVTYPTLFPYTGNGAYGKTGLYDSYSCSCSLAFNWGNGSAVTSTLKDIGTLSMVYEVEDLNATQVANENDNDVIQFQIEGYLEGAPPISSEVVAYDPKAYSTVDFDIENKESDKTVLQSVNGVSFVSEGQAGIGFQSRWQIALSNSFGTSVVRNQSYAVGEYLPFKATQSDSQLSPQGLIRLTDTVFSRDEYRFYDLDGDQSYEIPQCSNVFLNSNFDRKFEYKLLSCTPGDLESYTASSWNTTMSKLKRYQDEGMEDYLSEKVIPRAIMSRTDSWTSASAYKAQLTSSDSTFITNSSSYSSQFLAGAGMDFEGVSANFLSGVTFQNIRSEERSGESSLEISAACQGNAPPGFPYSEVRITTYYLESHNDWVYEIRYWLEQQGLNSYADTIPEQATCWKVMYVVELYE